MLVLMIGFLGYFLWKSLSKSRDEEHEQQLNFLENYANQILLEKVKRYLIQI